MVGGLEYRLYFKTPAFVATWPPGGSAFGQAAWCLGIGHFGRHLGSVERLGEGNTDAVKFSRGSSAGNRGDQQQAKKQGFQFPKTHFLTWILTSYRHILKESDRFT